jgi:hypothetical protein
MLSVIHERVEMPFEPLFLTKSFLSNPCSNTFPRAQNSLTPKKNKSNYTTFSSENTLENIHLRKTKFISEVVKVLRKLSAAIARRLAPAD